ncbi:MAG: hypothetical protein Kow0063_30300 [Anaerolineae bacterium]
MDWLPESLVIAGMFLVRLGVPIAITLVVAYFLRRLDARWQAEAWAEWAANQPQENVSVRARPFLTNEPCWALKGCDETMRANCVATSHPDLPCWLARRRSEGKLPAECINCAQFSLRQIA